MIVSKPTQKAVFSDVTIFVKLNKVARGLACSLWTEMQNISLLLPQTLCMCRVCNRFTK